MIRRPLFRLRYLVAALLLLWIVALLLPDPRDPQSALARIKRLVNPATWVGRRRLGVDSAAEARGGGRRKPQGTRSSGKRVASASCIVFGTVTDDKRSPVQNARVLVKWTDRKTSRSVGTDNQGAYRLAGLDAGIVDVAVVHPGFPAVVKQGILLEGGAAPVEVSFRLRFGMRVEGRVLTEEKKPLPGASVRARNRTLEHFAGGGEVYLDDAAYRIAETDTEGRFRVEGIGLGECLIEAGLHGYEDAATVLKIVAGKPPGPVDIILKRDGRIGGTVMDEESRPVSTATVVLTRYRSPGGESVGLSADKSTTVTGGDGRFFFGRLMNEGVYDIAIQHSDFAPGLFPGTPVGTEQMPCILERGGVIDGRAEYVDQITTPAHVLLAAETLVKSTTYTREIMTEPNGNFRFERLPYGLYRVYARSEGMGTEPRDKVQTARDRPARNVVVGVYVTATAIGRVIDGESEEPISGAKITVQSSYGPGQVRRRRFESVTNDSGEFAFDQLPGGFHIAQASAKGYIQPPSASAAQTFSLQPAERRTDLLLRLTHGGTVEGIVYDPQRNRVEGCEIQLFVASTAMRSFSARGLSAVTDGQGYFKIWGFDIGDRLQLYLSARKDGYAKTRSPLVDLSPRMPAAATEIILTPGGVLTGKVANRAKRALPGAKVEFSSYEFQSDPSPSSWDVRTGADGTYVLANCTPGRGLLTVSLDGYVEQRRNLTVKDTRQAQTQNFVLLDGRTISGRVADYANKPIADARVMARALDTATGRDEAVTDRRGEYQLKNLGEGYFRLDARFQLGTPDGQQTYRFVLSRVAAGSRSADFDCDVDNNASGKVVDEERKGVDSFRLRLSSRANTTPAQLFTFNLDRSYTTARGLFSLLKIPRGLYSLRIDAPGYQTYEDNDLVVGPHKRTTIPTITLKPAGAITGTLISSHTDRPVYNAVARVLDLSKPATRDVTRLELALVPRDDVIEYYDTYAEQTEVINAATENKPVAKVRANVVASSRSDYSGEFSVSSLSPGVYAVEFEHPDYQSLRMDEVGLLEKATVDLGRILLEPGGAVQGTVRAGDGTPIMYAVMKVSQLEPDKKTYTDAAGNYLLRGIRPGTWNITVKATVGSRKVYSYAPVVLSPGASVPLDFVLALNADVSGSVAGPSLRSGAVKLYALDDLGTPLTDIRYDATVRSNRFSITGIPSASYFAVLTGYAGSVYCTHWEHLTVLPGSNTVTLPVGKGQIRGRVAGPDGAPVGSVRLQLRPVITSFQMPETIYNLVARNTSSASSGNYAFTNLPPGPYQMFFLGPNGAWVPMPPLELSVDERLTGINVPYQ